MILLGSQVGTPAISPAGSNFDTMRALKSMPLRYSQILFVLFCLFVCFQKVNRTTNFSAIWRSQFETRFCRFYQRLNSTIRLTYSDTFFTFVYFLYIQSYQYSVIRLQPKYFTKNRKRGLFEFQMCISPRSKIYIG